MPKIQQTDVKAEMILMLDPETILADDNSRFGLKDTRIETLAKSILERGGLQSPIEVEPLAEASNGHSYKLTSGFYRLAAINKLNKEQGAGLQVPAIVRQTTTSKERLLRQLTENMERENQTPMDQAVAIDKLLQMGYPRAEIREVFKRPGGRKGMKVQPASNSYINMTHSFLQFPKAIQQKIHDGRLGVAAAYELTKQPREKWDEIVAKAEEIRQKDLDREEREETRFIEQEAKHKEAEEKATAVQTALDAAKSEEQSAIKAVDEKAAEAKSLFESTLKGDPKMRKEAQKKHREASSELVTLTSAADKATKARKAIEEKLVKAAQVAEERKVALQKARDAKKAAPAGAATKKAAVGPGDVKKAAAQAGTSKAVPLTLKEVRDVVNELCLPGGNAIIIRLGTALMACINGEVPAAQLYKQWETMLGKAA